MAENNSQKEDYMITVNDNESNDAAIIDDKDTANTLEEKSEYVIPSFLDILLDAGIRIIHKPPPLQLGETQNDRDYIDYLLRTCWDPRESRALLNKYGEDSVSHKELTYGEITATGARQLMEDMDLLATHVDVTGEIGTADEDVTFYDLGAGEGKLVVQILLESLGRDRVRLRKIVGVELSQARHEMSLHSWHYVQRALGCAQKNSSGATTNHGDNMCATGTNRYEKERGTLQAKIEATSLEGSTEASKLELVHSNLLQYDFSDATHVFASSIFFPDAVLRDMGLRLHQNATQYGKLKVVAALSDLEVLEQGTPCLWEKQTQRLQMSWGGAYVRLYRWKDY